MGKKEEVRDGFLGDLPEEIRVKVMNIHKLIVDTCNAEFKRNKYESINKQQWAKSMMDEFLTMPTDKNHVGSVRVYKKGNRYRCMIQMTGHVVNNRNTDDEELFHGVIRNAHTGLRAKVRRKFDVTIECESIHGEQFEGYDIWTKQKVAKQIWEAFSDKKTKVMKESVDVEKDYDVMVVEMHELPHNLQQFILESNEAIRICNSMNPDLYKAACNKDDIGFTVIRRLGECYEGSIMLTGEPSFEGYTEDRIEMVHNMYEYAINTLGERFAKIDPTKELSLGGESPNMYFEYRLQSEYAKKLYEWLENNVLNENTITVSIDGQIYTVDQNGEVYTVYNPDGSFRGNYDASYRQDIENEINSIDESKGFREIKKPESNIEKINDDKQQGSDNYKQIKPESNITTKDADAFWDNFFSGEIKEESVIWDPFTEANNVPEYNVDMTETQAKRTLRTLSQSIINDIEKDKNHKVSQYTANIYANIITKNLLPLWAKGYRKFSITLDSYQSFFTFEFKVPSITKDFVARFIEGRENINGFLHRNPEIKVKMSPRIFHTMKNPDDAFNFFKVAIKYYDAGISRYSQRLMNETMKLNREMKHLIATTKLSGIVTFPMQMLFVFDDVHMDNKDTFKIKQDDIKTINSFIRNIYSKYAAPEKEKTQIVDDIKKLVDSFNESVDDIGETRFLAEAVESLYAGDFNNEMESVKNKMISENIDIDWERNQKDPEIKVLQEKFGVKKLKKIPTDLVAYITIETEAIQDANDKMMIASYCLSKIEIVEWYIELLEVGSKKYIVPHSKPYLENVRTQLLACYKKIMAVKIKNPQTRPIIQIDYPQGYEG